MMTCFNCGRQYDDENKEKACTLIDSETGEESDITRIVFEKTEQALALCSYCTRAVVIGVVESSMSRRYTIKNFPYWYEKNKEGRFNGFV